MVEVDEVTKSWIRNRSDELAVDAGCRFDLDRANFVCDWIESHCQLYEGASGPLILRDWQRDATMRMFGWIRWSDRLNRWIRRFTRVSIYVPKKNKKTPTSAAWALYLLAGDGEPGNHIFFAATDGTQARLAAKHAAEMVSASAALDADQGGEISINRSEMKLSHIPTLSDLKPISSGDNRAARAKQGLNGSVIIDETHVVSRQFISESAIDRAGISRDEPLHIEISTAGKDPDSYGKSQYDFGKLVESGIEVDHQLLFICYEIPQDTKDEEIHADPLKFGRMANPAWGHTVHEEEYLADYNKSKRSLADFAEFKTFRLNVWQTASSPWIRISDWNSCRARYTRADMAGMTCSVGLDLAITRDMSAMVFMFPWEDDRFRIFPFFYLPQETAKRLAMRVPQVMEWIRDGYITTTPGATTDYRYIKEKFVALANEFNISKLIFDEHFAEQVTQEMSESTGVERFKFSQYLSRFNEPTQNFERLVLDGKIEHDGNPVLTWQMGHVNVITGKNGYMMPIKPEREEHKKIDGVVAAVMALAGAMVGSDDDWYARMGGLRG